MNTDKKMPYKRIKNIAFQHVCERIINKECIPFLGSGISNLATYQGSNIAYKNREGHTVAGMKKKFHLEYSKILHRLKRKERRDIEKRLEKLARRYPRQRVLIRAATTIKFASKKSHTFALKLRKKIRQNTKKDPVLAFKLRNRIRQNFKRTLHKDIFVPKDGYSLGKLCEEFVWRTNKSIDESLKTLVKTLEIQEMRELEPTLAHRCIALLVREGLFTQIITTNYDTCIEKAFIETFGEKWSNNRDKRLSIVHDLNSCSNQKPGKQGSGEQLHLYKINGCADALKHNTDYARNIILTNYQLQWWRDRRWAKDTFRVALRSNTILFSGFGSDEPQVIHTIHQIMDEYSSTNYSNNACKYSNNLPANAPIIHTYNIEPSFAHLQIVNNFVLSTCGKFNFKYAKKLIINSKDLEYTEEGGRLPADIFWARILQEVQIRLVIKILEDAMNGLLAISIIPISKEIFNEIKQLLENRYETTLLSLFDIEIKHSDKSKITSSSKWLTLISEILSTIVYNNKRYAPLNSYKNTVAELLFLFYILKDAHTRLKKIDKFWLLENAEIKLYLTPNVDTIRKMSYEKGINYSAAIHLSRDRFNHNLFFSDVRVINKTDLGALPLRIIVFHMYSIYQILLEENVSNKNSLQRILLDIIRSPSKYYLRLQKTKKDRRGKNE